MFVTLRVLPVATCVAALFGLVFGHSPGFCSSSVWGNVTEIPPEVPYHAYVGPGIVMWKVVVPQICRLGAVGAMITACDADSAPVLTIFNESTVYLKRSGNVWIPGSVDVNVFCHKSKTESKEPSKPDSGGSEETGESKESSESNKSGETKESGVSKESGKSKESGDLVADSN